MVSPAGRSRIGFVLLSLLICTTLDARAWGNEGHRIINRAAASRLPQSVPAFLRSADAINEIEYLGPEPDRWRSPLEPELNASQAPDHFIDLELADRIGPLPRSRYEYSRMLYAAALEHPQDAAKLAPEKVGFQPYIAIEVMERLQAALREWRMLSTTGPVKADDARAAQQSAILYAGWLGHYVADGSMPLHTTIQYNGWVSKENPNGYTTEHGIHAQFESVFVAANLKVEMCSRWCLLARWSSLILSPTMLHICGSQINLSSAFTSSRRLADSRTPAVSNRASLPQSG